MVVDKKITIAQKSQENHVFEYIIEWMSDYEVDLRVNSLLLLILQQDANLLSPLVGSGFEGKL